MIVMGLNISSNGLKIIKKYEGCRLTAYKCPAGVWTIGYGHTKGVKQGMTITQAKADAYLEADCKTFVKAVNKYYGTGKNKYQFNQNQFDALVSFTYNCGAGNLKALLNGGKRSIAEISKAIPKYTRANGKVLKGLANRRADEKNLFDKKVVNPYYDKYVGYSTKIDEVFKFIGVPSCYYGSYSKRKKVAVRNGIKTYIGSASQNMRLINLAKQGKLKKV
jgi:GH24 family phage-related lysozyme (muramidase)